MQAFMEELGGAVDSIAYEKTVDSSRVFAPTNSEEAIHAVNYQPQAKANRFKGLVLTGVPGRAEGGGRADTILESFEVHPQRRDPHETLR